MKTKNKFILIIFVSLAILGAGYYFLFSKEDKSGNSVADNTFGWQYPVTKFPLVGPTSNELAYSDIRDPGGIPEELPVRLKVPVIGVDSAVEDALITPDGRMDVPQGSVNVAWFALGPHPGEVGSAVIGGHFGIRNGVPFVFYKLDKLQIGDKVYIENDKGQTLAFQVRRIQLFDRSSDATTVFTSTDGLAHLNLITCEGIWNQVNGTYPERRVVFTDAISGEGTVAVKVPVVVYHPTLRIGARGVDVVALQNALMQKGFFGVSSKADGIFGKITFATVVKYQTSTGLIADGVFGPRSRAKLIPNIASLPNTAFSPSIENTSPSTLVSSLKSLYETPTDGLITTLLLILIFFIVFKILSQ